MRSIGMRELEKNAGRVLRHVRRKRKAVIVTRRGRPIARIVPLDDMSQTARPAGALWDEMDALAAEISAAWKGTVSGADAVSEGRRSL